MNHSDHVHLIKEAIDKPKGLWADLGSGDGAFTLALVDITNNQAEIFSIDKDSSKLQRQQQQFAKQFPESIVHYIKADFTETLDLPLLDGILMANSLHYIKDQIIFLKKIQGYLKPQGSLVLVEYNIDLGNTWVPYPLSFATFAKKAKAVGYINPILISTIASGFLQEIYCAKVNKT